MTHSSHKTRFSFDSSLYDEVCTLCGATDGAGDRRLRDPCPAAREETLVSSGDLARAQSRIAEMEAELAREKALREATERIAGDICTDLHESSGVAVARAEERARTLALIEELFPVSITHAQTAGAANCLRVLRDKLAGAANCLRVLRDKLLENPSPPPGGALAARLAEALEALKPFVSGGDPKNAHDDVQIGVTATLGDLRRARGVLQRGAGGGK